MPTARLPTVEEQRFLAHCGLIQWAEAVCRVRDRIKEAEEAIHAAMLQHPRGLAIMDIGAPLRTEHDFFANAAQKLIAYRIWAAEIGVFDTIDFSGLDAFNRVDIADLRNMHEHITEYYGQQVENGKEGGRYRGRWATVSTEGIGDASGATGKLIGNRLDYAAFADVVAALLPALKQAPIPYPPISSTPFISN